MADAKQIFLRWAFKPEAQKATIIKNVLAEYGNIIYLIAEDIFNSCIEHYYQYEPKVYKRHGNIKGFNLYQLENISFDGMNFQIGFDSDFLLKYGTKEDIREEVMNAVFSGTRGLTERNGKPVDSRRTTSWKTSYPNEFSQYDYWQSECTTIDDIFYDFVKHVIKDTKDLFWNTFSKYV